MEGHDVLSGGHVMLTLTDSLTCVTRTVIFSWPFLGVPITTHISSTRYSQSPHVI